MQREETPTRVPPHCASPDTHFVPMRHSLKSSERFRPIPGATASQKLASRSPTRTGDGCEASTASSASAPPGRPRAVSPHGVQLSGCTSVGSVHSDCPKSPPPLLPGSGHFARYPMSISPLRCDGTVSTPTTPMASPMPRSRMCPSPCRTMLGPLIQRPAPVSPRAVEKLLAVPTPLNGIRYAASQEKPTFSRATTPQVRTPQAPLGRHSGWDLDTPKGRYSQSPSQARHYATRSSPGIISLAAAACVATQQLQAAEVLEKARQLSVPSGPPKNSWYEAHGGGTTPIQGQGPTGATPPRERALRMTQPVIKVCVEPPVASTATPTPGSERSLDRSTPEETTVFEVKLSDVSDDMGQALSNQIQQLEDAGTSDPKEWWQVIAETRAWRRSQRARQGLSQDIADDG